MTAQNLPKTCETTPLLNSTVKPPSSIAEETVIHPATESHGNQIDDDDDDKPLPKVQIFLLCFARLIEPVAFFGVFPFINKMIWENGGIEESDVGFYSGLIVCFPFFFSPSCPAFDYFHANFKIILRSYVKDDVYK
jgi:hypothetical protein